MVIINMMSIQSIWIGHFYGSIFVTAQARKFFDGILLLMIPIPTLFNSWSLGLLLQSRFSGDISHIEKCFDKSTKLRFRNADEPQYIKFGTLRDKDPNLNIRSGQLKITGYASNIISRPSRMYYYNFFLLQFRRRLLLRTVHPMHCGVYQSTARSFRHRDLSEKFVRFEYHLPYILTGLLKVCLSCGRVCCEWLALSEIESCISFSRARRQPSW